MTQKMLGLLGGMSWESTAHYYAQINRSVRGARGGLHSARLLLHSVDFAPIADMQRRADWAAAAQLLGEAGRGLAAAGAGTLLICTNTMHKVAGQIEEMAGIPLLHIADPTIAALRAAGVERVGLLGTRFTMEDDFYSARLCGAGLQVCVPDTDDRTELHRVIFEELCRGLLYDASRLRLLAMVDALRADGAQAVILGCTEIAMLLGQDDTDMPLFDTTGLHADAAAAWLLG
ncbi:aspartate/glutamate racemase family protein [Vogesella sp. DC21W]|uniref:Aspartate/glutamate racemase family protein n=1 Tax=Vogesella aquatica TaxID=2984206 RepID=A0ABT5J0L8_9NEIS|nr:aspartate/glutamate racemase family protein [Vogesella aquatica]MDC7718374.1 aspartate/glutamate racemase family protein [Vogesella aquatica]